MLIGLFIRKNVAFSRLRLNDLEINVKGGLGGEGYNDVAYVRIFSGLFGWPT
ncbi:hypothetical protein ES703_28103 [subsurface metagenome]